jgi:glucuronoarabinoxylan endo-1,4-beta-xylanase
MRSTQRRTSLATIGSILLLVAGQAQAQTATVDVTSKKQYIRGFGGMVHIPWAGDLTAAERTLAFGNEDGQLGFTVLRIAVPDGSANSTYVATAKAAIANGGIVYATPWNGSGSMSSSDFATYADHLSSFVSYMKGQGAELYAIGTQNEPDYGSQGGWKVWTAAQCHDFMLNYGDKIGTKLITCESFSYAKGLYDPILNDPAALEKVGVLGTHLYGTSVSGYPYPLYDQKVAGKFERWMTEHYTDSNTDANSWPNALGVASELHNAMVEAQFNAYTWWYIKRSYGPINNGAITKRGYCMAHWSKFVRPGFYRVDATKSPTSGVSLSAYRSDTDVVIVAVNTATSAKSITVSLNGSTISSFDKYTTSSSKSLAKEAAVTASNGSLTLSLDAQSVTTLHGTGANSPAGNGGASGGTGGATGSGGASGTGGSMRPDAGRDALAAGGASGSDASRDSRELTDSAGATGGAFATGGTLSAGAGGVVASGGQVGTGGVVTATGGQQTGSGGAAGTPGTSPGADGSTSSGCTCQAGGHPGRSGIFALFVLLPALAWFHRRSLRRLSADGQHRPAGTPAPDRGRGS